MNRSPSNWNRETRRVEFKPWQKRFVLRRDRNICYRCGGFGDQIDHVIPIAEGGANHTDNGGCTCESCHDIKSREESARGYARHRAKSLLKPEQNLFDVQET